jgi:uncharacterized membrane protein
MTKLYSIVILFFFIYSIIGWLWETVYCSLKAKKFVYRGFLIGPYCPIYGFGITMVLYFIEPFHNNLVLLYLFSTILVTLLEFFTSYCLEKIFHTTWWDYHNVPFNIQGRIALPVSAFWGAGCVFIVRVVHPFVNKVVEFLYNSFGMTLPVIIVCLLTADTVLSVLNMLSLQKTVKNFHSKLENQAQNLKLSFETRAQHFNNFIESEISKRKGFKEKINERKLNLKENMELKLNTRKLKFNEKRLLNAFPNIKFKKLSELKNPRDLLLKLDKIKKKTP